MPAPISAPALLQVYTTLLDSTNLTTQFGTVLSRLGLGTSKPLLPLSIWKYFQGLSVRASDGSCTSRQAVVSLQSFITLALYHCQDNSFNNFRQLLITDDNANTIVEDIVALFPVAEPDTDIVPAVLRYNLKVNRAALLAHIIITWGILGLCLAVQIAGSCTVIDRRMRAELWNLGRSNESCHLSSGLRRRSAMDQSLYAATDSKVFQQRVKISSPVGSKTSGSNRLRSVCL